MGNSLRSTVNKRRPSRKGRGDIPANRFPDRPAVRQRGRRSKKIVSIGCILGLHHKITRSEARVQRRRRSDSASYKELIIGSSALGWVSLPPSLPELRQT